MWTDKLAKRVQELETENSDLREQLDVERRQLQQLTDQLIASENELRCSEHEAQLAAMQMEALQVWN